MLGVILNEKKIVEDFKNDYSLPQAISILDLIKLLIKYYYSEGNDKDEIYKFIMDDLKNSLEDDFIYTKWNNMVKSNITRFIKLIRMYNINTELTNITEVKITNNELEKIKLLDDIVLEKIAFVLLVYAKITIQQNKNKDCWINQSCITICKEAKVGLRGVEQMRKMNELYIKKYIDMSKINTRTNIKVCFVDDKTSGEGLIIDDFNGVVYRYLIWKGENWKRCQVCNKWIKIKGKKDNSKKYCKACAKQENIRKTVENRKKFESNKSV